MQAHNDIGYSLVSHLSVICQSVSQSVSQSQAGPVRYTCITAGEVGFRPYDITLPTIVMAVTTQ